MDTKTDDARAPLWSSRQLVPIASLPERLFQPSEELAGKGWPDFSPRTLADWTSSSAPAPEVPTDCCLVLCYWRMAPMVTPSSDWIYLLHETGGIWGEAKRLLGRRLETGERGVAVAHYIGRAMAQTNCSATHAALDQLIEYRNVLNAAGLDCNHHIQALAEGFYPIDLSEEALQALDVHELHDLDEWTADQPTCLAVLAPNVSEW